MRNVLMGIQVALAVVVLIVAALFFRSFLETRDTDPGFRREGVLLAAYDLAGRASSQATNRAFADRLLDRVRALPSVEAAAIATSVPLDIHGLPSRVFTVEGRARTDAGFDRALTNTVTPGTSRSWAFRCGRGRISPVSRKWHFPRRRSSTRSSCGAIFTVSSRWVVSFRRAAARS